MSSRTVVVAMGNEYRRDDGAGVAVVRAVAPRLAALSTAAHELVDVGPLGDPLDLLGHWDHAGLAVVVDAVRTGAPPGTVVVLELGGPDAGGAAGHGGGDHGGQGDHGDDHVDGRAGHVDGRAGHVDGRATHHDAPEARTSTHGLGVAGALRLARAVGRAPARVVAVGIEGEDFGEGTGLSGAVAAAVDEAAARVLAIVGASR